MSRTKETWEAMCHGAGYHSYPTHGFHILATLDKDPGRMVYVNFTNIDLLIESLQSLRDQYKETVDFLQETVDGE